MKTNLGTWLAVALCLAHFHASAQDSIPPGMRTNGCGAANSWSSKLVPNDALLGFCQFKQACDAHDRCYSRCLEGGVLFGKAECNDAPGSENSSRRRMVCDAALGTGIMLHNKDKRVCSFYASLYQWAVERFGESSFSGIGEGDAVFHVIREFLNYAQANPEKYTEQDQTLLLAALAGLDGKSNENFEATFDRFSGKFTLVKVQGAAKVIVVRIPQKARS